MKEKLVIFSAPSGAGKTTIVREILNRRNDLEFSISACSRERRGEEVDGKDYYFLGVEGFKQAIEDNAFLEWEEVYPNQFYGTLKSEVERIWKKGSAVIFDIDVIGGMNLKAQYKEKATSVFVMPPDMETLENRLRGRKTETDEKIAIRIGKAREEISKSTSFDHIIVNDNLDQAITEAEGLLNDFLK